MTGQEGESIALSFLVKKGYQIVERNFKCSFGEIDLIAWEGKTLVFIEVKARASKLFGGPEAAVDFKKQQKINRVALFYLQQKKITDSPCRFDVVGIVKTGQEHTITLYQNAFDGM
ncbi:MAG: YraN family protein [Nitrospirota bacterium]